MASRKTYFGIGWPKDPADGAPRLDEGDDRKDDGPSGEHSAPTVVDDEKVAEGLAQLRSWYQSDTAEGTRPAASSMPAAPSSELPGARPTAVGHASSQAPMPARPLAPDPMRATMFGHDIHRFDFDAPLAAPDAAPVTSSPPAADRGPAAASAGASASASAAATDASPRRPEPTPRPPEWEPNGGQPDPFRIADYLRRQAAQPHQAAARWVASRDTVPVRTNRGLPLLVFAIGFVALAVAVLLSVLSRDNPSRGAGSAAPAPAPVLTGSALERPPTPGVPAAAPMQNATRAVTAPRPIDKAPTGGAVERSAAKRVESSGPSLLAKPKRRPAPVKTDTESNDDESAAAPATTEARQPDDGASTAPAATPAEAAERPAPRPPARPKKREKSIPLVDSDSTLPPSTDE